MLHGTPLFQVCTLLSWLSGPHTALFIKIIIFLVVSPHFLLHFIISLSLILHLHVENGQWEMKSVSAFSAAFCHFALTHFASPCREWPMGNEASHLCSALSLCFRMVFFMRVHFCSYPLWMTYRIDVLAGVCSLWFFVVWIIRWFHSCTHIYIYTYIYIYIYMYICI